MDTRTVGVFSVAGAVFLSGCVSAPRYERPAMELPSQFSPAAASDAPADSPALERWWTLFGDARLNQLMERALRENAGLMQSAAAVEQARAQLGLAQAALWPSLSASASAQRSSVADWQRESGQPNPLTSYRMSGLLDYELDLFGRLRASRAAAREDLAASEYAHQAMRSLLAADVATTYFNAIAARRQLELAKETVVAREQSLDVQRKRFEAGYIPELALQQARASLADANVLIPQLLQQVETFDSALSVLVGSDPAEIWAGESEVTTSRFPKAPDLEVGELQVDVLRRRPDIQAAEAQLRAANQRIGVAEAARWPSVSLSGVIGAATLDLDALFGDGNAFWTLVGDAAGPVYDFGRSASRVRSAEAAREEAAWRYTAVTRRAFRELRDAATVSDRSEEAIAARQTQREAIERTYEVAQAQYESGYLDYLELLDAERGLISARLALVDAQLRKLVATAELFRALGGGAF